MGEGSAQRIAVIGAGPAGATAAYLLAKAGAEVDVYEASGGVGGMARSIELWGQTVDIGPHRFTGTDPRVNELWLEVIGGDYEMVRRRTRILLRGHLLGDPPRPAKVLRHLGPREAVRHLLGGPDRRFRQYYRPYAEKLFGLPAGELDPEAVAHLFDEPEQFPHPRQGTGEVYARMCDHVEKQGGRVHLDTPVARLVLDGTRVTGVQLNSAEIREHDHVVSSMPLTVLAARLPDLPPEVSTALAGLTFRNTVVVYLRTTAESVFPDTWIRVTDPGLRAGRITNFDNWVPTTKRGERETVLALEYWCGPDDDFWRWDDDRYVALARAELVRTGLVGAGEITGGEALRVPKSAPVYRRGFRAHLEVVVDHLRRIEGLEVVGRYGAFKHGGQDQGILMGLLAAENVLRGAGHDLWSAAPRPGSRIVATGLERV